MRPPPHRPIRFFGIPPRMPTLLVAVVLAAWWLALRPPPLPSRVTLLPLARYHPTISPKEIFIKTPQILLHLLLQGVEIGEPPPDEGGVEKARNRAVSALLHLLGPVQAHLPMLRLTRYWRPHCRCSHNVVFVYPNRTLGVVVALLMMLSYLCCTDSIYSMAPDCFPK